MEYHSAEFSGAFEPLFFGLGILDCSYIEECLLWQIVYLAVENSVESLDSLFDWHHHTWQTGEL